MAARKAAKERILPVARDRENDTQRGEYAYEFIKLVLHIEDSEAHGAHRERVRREERFLTGHRIPDVRRRGWLCSMVMAVIDLHTASTCGDRCEMVHFEQVCTATRRMRPWPTSTRTGSCVGKSCATFSSRQVAVSLRTRHQAASIDRQYASTDRTKRAKAWQSTGLALTTT